MLDPFFIGTLFLAVGLVIGWALGTLSMNASLICYFRDYYRRQAEARVRQHMNFLLTQTNNFGTALQSHRRAATEAFDGGRQGFRRFSPFDYTARGKAERKEGQPVRHITEFLK
jgi:hypothetical protein